MKLQGHLVAPRVELKKVLGATQTCLSLVRGISEMRCNFSNHVTKSPRSHKLGIALKMLH